MSTAVAFKSTRSMLRAAAYDGYELTIDDVINLVCGDDQIHVPDYRMAMESSPHFGVVSQLANQFVAKEWGPQSEAYDLKCWIKAQLTA